MKEENWKLDEVKEWDSFAFQPLDGVRYFQDTLQEVQTVMCWSSTIEKQWKIATIY
jgi:hypothetical protein